MLKDLPNVFGIADDILIVGYNADGRDYDKTMKWVDTVKKSNTTQKYIILSVVEQHYLKK